MWLVVNSVNVVLLGSVSVCFSIVSVKLIVGCRFVVVLMCVVSVCVMCSVGCLGVVVCSVLSSVCVCGLLLGYSGCVKLDRVVWLLFVCLLCVSCSVR